MAPDQLPDFLRVALELAAHLDRLGIRYVAGGSLASSFHGEPRSTNDVDLVIALPPSGVDALVAALGELYYISAEAARQAARTGGVFNVIHLDTAVKADLFVAGADPFDAERIACGTREALGESPTSFLRIDTAENTILRKLEWYRRGAEVSERQWRDVLGIIRAQGAHLDWTRLESWAPRLGVSDLLMRARREGMGAPPD